MNFLDDSDSLKGKYCIIEEHDMEVLEGLEDLEDLEGLDSIEIIDSVHDTEVTALGALGTLGELNEVELIETLEDCSEHEVQQMREINQNLGGNEKPLTAGVNINVKFHELIQEIAGNRWMNGVIGDLRKVLKLQRRDSLGRSGRLQSALHEHRNILKALIKRDGAAAQEAMQAHLARGLEATRYTIKLLLNYHRAWQ
jgi:hypothetical protein